MRPRLAALYLLGIASLSAQVETSGADLYRQYCAACHGQNGNSANPEWPSLAGQNAVHITEQLKLFRASHRNNAIMYPLAAGLSDEDIADVAAYFASQTPTGGEADPATWQAGAALYRAGDHKPLQQLSDRFYAGEAGERRFDHRVPRWLPDS